MLSTFAGASRELLEALIVNPFDAAGMGEACFQALTMPPDEQRERMRPHARDGARQQRLSAGPAACCSTRRACANAATLDRATGGTERPSKHATTSSPCSSASGRRRSMSDLAKAVGTATAGRTWRFSSTSTARCWNMPRIPTRSRSATSCAGFSNDRASGWTAPLAFITGRSVAAVDRLFLPLKLRVAGLYGLEHRLTPGGAVEVADEPADIAALADEIEAELGRGAGLFRAQGAGAGDPHPRCAASACAGDAACRAGAGQPAGGLSGGRRQCRGGTSCRSMR